MQQMKYTALFPQLDARLLDYSSTFDFTATDQYNPRNNYLLSQLSALVYKEEQEIQDQIVEWNTRGGTSLKVYVENVESFRFMIISTSEFIIVAFRGTINYQNWLADFDLKKVPFDDGVGEVHQGFYDSVLKMENAVDKAVRKISVGSEKIYVTGHSLGGAQAVIWAYTFSSLKQFVSIHTYGVPRIGNSDLINFMDQSLHSEKPNAKSKVFRMVNAWDPVPHVPYFGYYHVGGFYLYNASVGDSYALENTPKPASATDEEMMLSEDEKMAVRINYHSIGVYVENAEANVKNPVFS